MLERQAYSEVEWGLKHYPAVVLLGPRQVGKTSLARKLAQSRDAVYLDLENLQDMNKLEDPNYFFELHREKLVILDEVHQKPELFSQLRGQIDQMRWEKGDEANGRYLLLGSGSMDLMRQSQSLAGRVKSVNMSPILLNELPDATPMETLWLRGGLPLSLLAKSEALSLDVRMEFINTYLLRDIALLNQQIPTILLRNLWTMLAHQQGGLLNLTSLAKNLEVKTGLISQYIDFLMDLLLVRKLQPYHRNTNKRIAKSPKVYVRDSGLTHALLNIHSLDELLGHPVLGGSWEGFVLENLLACSPAHTLSSFYRTAQGAEIDLILELGGTAGTWAVEVKRSLAPRTDRGFTLALEDVQPQRAFVVYSGQERYPKSADVEVISLLKLMQELQALRLPKT